MTDVVKNLLILNVLMFLAMLVLESKGINLTQILGMHYIDGPLFEPYQTVSYMFMHGGLFHLLFNMIGLVIFGSMLERVWGPKRFFIFYFATGIGAVLVHTIISYVSVNNMLAAYSPEEAQNIIDFIKSIGIEYYEGEGVSIPSEVMNTGISSTQLSELLSTYHGTMIGASGAVMGVLIGFAMLFPNTEIMLIIPPIPVKAKYLALILIRFDLYMAYANNPGDNIAHFAHLGGALVGFILVLIWRRNRTNFY